jgi:toxin ParE1/3/4
LKPAAFWAASRVDVEDAKQWYEARRTGLGRQFEHVVQNCVRAVQSRPKHFRKWHGVIRRALTKQFPYAVYYLDEPERIVVIAVIHAKRSRGVVWRRFRDGA